MIIIPFPDFFMLFLGNRSVLFKAALAGESRQPHLTLAVGVDIAVVVKGDEEEA